MNFSFYKNLSTNYLFLFFLFLGLLISFTRCVKIQDLIAPTIEEFALNEQYNITDTIFLDVNLFDNFVIESTTINIKSLEGTSSLDTTLVISSDSIKARSLNLIDYPIYIPADAILGEYKLTITVTDGIKEENNTEDPNITTTEKFFAVNGDIEKPNFYFPNVILPDIDGVSQSPACQLQVLIVQGVATDNVGLREIRAQLIGQNSGTVYLTIREIFAAPNEPNSVDLQDFFDDNLTIPTNVPNGNLILKLIAIDIEGHEYSVTDTILVDCDRIHPDIIELTTNRSSSNNEIQVIQGQELFITGGLVTDNQELDSIFIYLDDDSDSATPTSTDTLIARKIDGLSFNLTELDSISVLPLVPRLGIGFYKIRMEVVDAVGNRTTQIFNIRININLPPTPTVNNIYIDNIEFEDFRASNSNTPIPILAASIIEILIKIEEDVALLNYKITWKVDGSTREPSLIQENNNINRLPFNTTREDAAIIRVDDYTPNVGTRYVLTVAATDTFNQTTQVTYYFIVVQ
ncbi:hypothetical protein Fleli_3333 [Bernardetia litoralis DSM 6794]|uniref:Uncharacterized protein n=1 Tax=Bernardetia litoralis (strain ATCC 23117 / DSM 6794 / NBRC 15988 / NCIMB 1366 / Fx l1 / Sio-4) TaxID=880071 RepID=I4ANX7_BERLS|nr:hypothetical protein [Bernardetia litoralis]AFM05662.1 hypothetical protein Fleli_3333 [Bernardetia litoralis DSM 6794]